MKKMHLGRHLSHYPVDVPARLLYPVLSAQVAEW